MKVTGFVIYSLVWHEKGILIDCPTFIFQRQRPQWQQSLAGRHYSDYTRAQSLDDRGAEVITWHKNKYFPETQSTDLLAKHVSSLWKQETFLLLRHLGGNAKFRLGDVPENIAYSAPTVFPWACSVRGDEFLRRLCNPLPPLTPVLYYRWLAAGLHDKIISQGVGGHRVYVGILLYGETAV